MTNIPQSQKMTQNRFKDIIASYGGDVACWPADEAAAMHDLLASTPELQSIINEAGQLDQLLGLSPTPAKISDAFMDRLMAIPSDHKQPSVGAPKSSFGILDLLMEVFQVASPMALAPRIAGLAAAAVLGIMVGTTNIAQFDQATHIVDASQLMISDSGLMRDLSELN